MSNQMIQLLPGLQISFSDDGTWLHFDGKRIKSTIRLESLSDRPGIIGAGISEWCERIRESAITKPAEDASR